MMILMLMRLGQHLEKICGTDDAFLQGKAAAYGQHVVVVSGVVGVDGHDGDTLGGWDKYTAQASLLN